MNDSHSIKQALAEYSQELGFSRFGVAPALPLVDHQEYFRAWLAAGYHGPLEYMERHASVRGNPETLLEGAKSVICLVVDYGGEAPPGEESLPEGIGPGGKVARYARSRDYHIVLKKRLQRLGKRLQELAPGARVRPMVDQVPFLERAYAWRAGLGFLAKNSMLITPGVGSYTLLAELLTDQELPPDQPQAGTCGGCTRCLEACPTGAIVAPGKVDAARCISCWTIEVRGPLPDSAQLSGWAFGCDICQEVCPYNTVGSHLPLGEDFATPRAAGRFLEVRDLQGLRDYAAFRDRFAGTPIMRARQDGLERNLSLLEQQQAKNGLSGSGFQPESKEFLGEGGRDPTFGRIMRKCGQVAAVASGSDSADGEEME